MHLIRTLFLHITQQIDQTDRFIFFYRHHNRRVRAFPSSSGPNKLLAAGSTPSCIFSVSASDHLPFALHVGTPYATFWTYVILN
jgi:hypothetical protein